jgi:hypothetical protein
MDRQAVASSSKNVIGEGQSIRVDEEGDNGAFRLPSRRRYFITVTSVAFIAGVGFGVGYAIRYSRRMRLEELRAAADAEMLRGHNGVNTSLMAASADKQLQSSPLKVATSQGPFALFREMNKAAFVRFTGRETGRNGADAGFGKQEAPSILRRKPTRSRHDDFGPSSSSVPPSILMRSPVQQAAKESVIQPKSRESTDNLEDLPLGQTPAVLGAKALGIATAIVGVTALVGIEVVYRVLGVKNTDELVDRLSMIIPVSEQTVKTFEPVGRAARRALRGTFGEHGASEADSFGDQQHETDQLNDGIHLGDVEDTLQQLDDAVERGDTQTWFEVLSKRLNAERTFDIAERRRRIAAVDAESTS